MLPLIVDHLTKRYGDDVVVDDLTFTVAPGRVTCFLGPNGAGKSTTMKILLDLARADQGHTTIGGTRYRDMADPARSVGVVLEPNAFHPARSGRNHLRILADGAGLDHDRIAQALDAVGLAHAADRHVGGYSLGMRQRLGLAAALLGDPRCSCSTSRATGWTHKASDGCVTSCNGAPRQGTRCSSPATCSPRWSSSPTTSS